MAEKASEDFMRRAIALATRNVLSGAGGPFGAVVVRGGAIVGEGTNMVTASSDPTAHAEMNAIRAAARALGKFSLEGCELYASCEPCPMCLAAAYWARIDKIYFGCLSQDAARAGFDDSFVYEQLRAEAARRTLPEEQMLRDEAWASLEAWIASPSKVPY